MHYNIQNRLGEVCPQLFGKAFSMILLYECRNKYFLKKPPLTPIAIVQLQR